VVWWLEFSHDNKQLLDEVFFDIQNKQGWGRGYQPKAEADNPLPRPWLFWISQKPNVIIVLLDIEQNKKKSWFCFVTDGKQDKASK